MKYNCNDGKIKTKFGEPIFGRKKVSRNSI